MILEKISFHNIMDILNRYENIALSNLDLIRMLDGKANIIIYPNLINYQSIDDVLGPYGACFLLFETRPKYGHWVCLFKRGNIIEFFNSYGGYPDDSAQYIPLHYRIISGQAFPILSLLLLNSPYELEYNEFKFQRHNKNIKTCGRWAVVRLLLRELDIYQFKKFIDDLKKETGLTRDKIVTLLTT